MHFKRCSGERCDVHGRHKGAEGDCDVEIAELLKWVLEVAALQRWCDCLLDCRQEVWLVVPTHSLVDFVGGRGEGGMEWLREIATLWYRMGPVRRRIVHHRHPGHTSNDLTRFRQDPSL